MRIIISDRNRKETSLKSELHSAQILLSSTVDHYKSKTKEVTLLKKDFKQKEDKFLEEFLDLKKLKDKIEDRPVHALYLDLVTAAQKHMTGNRSKLMNFVESHRSVRFGNDHLGAIKDYVDYVSDSVILKSFYVRDVDTIYLCRQFCNSDLEVPQEATSLFGIIMYLYPKPATWKKARSSSHRQNLKIQIWNSSYPVTWICVGAMRVQVLKEEILLVIVDDYSEFTWKGYRIYNKRTRRLMETIHVTFDEMHQSMTAVRISSGPEPASDRPDPVPAQSSYGNVNAAEPNQVNYPPDHIRRWTKDHPSNNIVGNPSRHFQPETLASDALWCLDYKVKLDEYGDVLKNKASVSSREIVRMKVLIFEESFAQLHDQRPSEYSLPMRSTKIISSTILIQNCFSNGDLQEEVLSASTEGLEDRKILLTSYRLKKALYGLKAGTRRV
ncbi:hypothetical protein Tco_1256478 [Tanacetum coccineum]